jgi:alkanesulfonate monooxygenase SsuD/methylene tetrahydromethanopterin reductase-like flavin-dependent oxidoreductase (luciferase family)
MTDVHLGLIAPNYGPGLKPDNLLEAATTAERAGYPAVWGRGSPSPPRPYDNEPQNNVAPFVGAM